jgi:hypothetical protein
MTEQEQNKTDDSTKSGSASTAPTPPITNSTLKTTNADVGVVVRRRRRRVVAEEEGPAVDPILLQKVLTESSLPSAYTFEVTKSVKRILKLQATHVALQMPEGLLLYATVLADVSNGWHLVFSKYRSWAMSPTGPVALTILVHKPWVPNS